MIRPGESHGDNKGSFAMWSFMIIVSIVCFASGGMFYSAALSTGHGNRFADDVCGYGAIFCAHPDWLILAGGASLFVALFMRLFVMIRG